MAKKTTPYRKNGKSSLWQKLKLNTKNKKLLTFAITFGLLGGGYFVYQSFADEPIENGNIIVSGKTENLTRSYIVDSSSEYASHEITYNGLDFHVGTWNTDYSDFGTKAIQASGKVVGDAHEYNFKVINLPDMLVGDEFTHRLPIPSEESHRYGKAVWLPDSNQKIAMLRAVTPIEAVGINPESYDLVVLDRHGFEIYEDIMPTGTSGRNAYIMGRSNGAIYIHHEYYTVDSDEGVVEVYALNKSLQIEQLARLTGSSSQYHNYNNSTNRVIAPNKEKVAFVYRPDTGNHKLFVSNLDYSNSVEYDLGVLIDIPETRSSPTVGWSPDGNFMYIDNYIINATTGKLIKVLDYGANSKIDIWFPKTNDVYAGSFNPANSTTRQAMAAFLYRTAGHPDVPTANDKYGNDKSGPFSDVGGNHRFCKEIEYVRAQGITEGYNDGTYRPTDPVSRQAMAAFLWRSEGRPEIDSATEKCGVGKPGPFRDVSGTHTFCKEIEWLRSAGITTGYNNGTFRPAAHVSRQAMASFLHRVNGEVEANQTLPVYGDVDRNHQFFDAIQWLGESSDISRSRSSSPVSKRP